MQFDAFYSSSNFDTASVRDQQQYLILCLSRTLGSSLYTPKGANTPSCMSALERIFDHLHPVIARRQALLRMRCDHGKSYANWTTRLKKCG